MAATQVKLDTVIYPVFGIGAYWGWSSSVMITSGIWPNAAVGPAQADWLANVVSHCLALIVLSLLAGHLRNLAGRRRWGLASAALISLGTALMVLGNFGPALAALATVGSVSSGVGTAGALLFWARALLAIDRTDVQHSILAGSIVVALVGTVLILCLPPWAGSLLCIALPFAIVLCAHDGADETGAMTDPCDPAPSVREARSCTARPEALSETGARTNANMDALEKRTPKLSGGGSGLPRPDAAVASGSKADTAPARPKSRLWELARLYLCCFILALAAGMHQASSSQSAPASSLDQWRTLYASVCILVSAAAYLDLRLSSSRFSHLFSRMIVPLIAGGLLIIAVVGNDANGWGGVPMQTGYHLFLIYIYTEFALQGRTNPQPLLVFIRGTIAIDAGLLAGCAFTVFAGGVADDGIRSVTLAVVYLLLLVGVLLFPNVIASVAQRSQRRTRLVIAEQDEQASLLDAPLSTATPSVAQAAAFAQNLGLSPREREVFDQLLRGHTLPAIAAEAHLSYNTVKTHVSHIYQKAGVHTRDELIDLLEHQPRS